MLWTDDVTHGLLDTHQKSRRDDGSASPQGMMQEIGRLPSTTIICLSNI